MRRCLARTDKAEASSSKPDQAREAAAAHMGNAIGRIRKADPVFWAQEGERLAQALVKGLQS